MKKMLFAVMASSLVFCAASFADEIKVEAGGTAIATIFNPIKQQFEKVSGHTLSIVQSTAVKALIALNDGKVDIAAGAHPLEDLIKGAATEGVVIDTTNLVAEPIEENRLIVIANKANKVTKLSKADLKGIFTGKIKNWKEVGGRDIPVKVVWGKETTGQNIQFTRVALDGEAVTPKNHHATDYWNISKLVSQTPGGIGVVPMEITTAATRSLDTVPITSPIYIITKGKPSEKVQAVIDFYRKEYSLPE